MSVRLPSILNIDNIPRDPKKLECDIDPEVFCDLRLDRFFTEETLTILSFACGGDDIEARLDMYDAAEKHESEINRLYQLADEICDVSKRLNKARCDPERSVIFIEYVRRCIIFIENAAALPESFADSGIFAGRFAGYVRETAASEKFRSLMTRDAECAEEFSKTRSATLNISMGSPLIYKSPMDSHITRLSELARELGCNEIKLPTHNGREISTGLIAGFETLYPAAFRLFENFYADFSDYFGQSFAVFRSELKFYRELLDWSRRLSEGRVKLCRPKVSAERKIMAKNCRDVTLLLKNTTDIVPNDLEFTTDERLFFLTGANGGGKTSYLRSLGVCLILFLGGCRVPCDSAEIYPFRRIFTHFPHDERFNGTGRLLEEKLRVDDILKACDGDSVILFNETFSGTDEAKSTALTAETAELLLAKESFGVYVTHLHSLGETVLPALNVMVDESDLNRRTYKVVRHGQVKSSFAQDILFKYSLTGKQLEARTGKPEVKL